MSAIPFQVPPLPTREEAIERVVKFEQTLRESLRSVNPEEFVPEASHRLRRTVLDPAGFMGQHPPHVLVHAIEANCAYWQQWRYEPLTGAAFRKVINLFHELDDPAMRHLIQDTDLFEFMLYIHRVQIDAQGGVGWMQVGRFVRLVGDGVSVPECDARFRRNYGLSIRRWCQLAWALQAATMGTKVKFTPKYAEQICEIGIPSGEVAAFLAEVARTPAQVGAHYRAARTGTPPLTWMQRRPHLAMHPVIRVQQGYVVPAEAYVADLFGESVYRRILDDADAACQAEIGDRLEHYIEELIGHFLPSARLWTHRVLERPDARSSDFVVELADCVLLIECKATVLRPELATSNAVLGSAAAKRIVDGFHQSLATATRVRDGGYQKLGIDRSKPRFGIVVTLGEIPSANHPAVWTHAVQALAKQGVDAEVAVQSLAYRPQVFPGMAFEHLVLCLANGIAAAPVLFEEIVAKRTLATGDWETELTRRCAEHGRADLGFWREPASGLMEELGFPAIPNPDA